MLIPLFHFLVRLFFLSSFQISEKKVQCPSSVRRFRWLTGRKKKKMSSLYFRTRQFLGHDQKFNTHLKYVGKSQENTSRSNFIPKSFLVNSPFTISACNLSQHCSFQVGCCQFLFSSFVLKIS